jgi:hypothetical protein
MRVRMVKPLGVKIRPANGLIFYQSVSVFKSISRVVPPNPQTPDQTAARSFLGRSKQTWALCTPAQKAQWSEFAQKEFTVNRRDFPKTWRGIDAFSRASVARQIAGLDPMPEVPESGRPDGATRMLLLPGSNERELAFTMQHHHGNSEGLALLVRLTPTGPTPGKNPYKRNLRHVRGMGPQSVLPLPQSGEVVTIPDVRFVLQAGHRYAVELRVLRLADGAVSDAYYQVGVRQQDAEIQAKAETEAEAAGRMPAVPGEAEAETESEDLTRSHGDTEEKQNTKAEAEAGRMPAVPGKAKAFTRMCEDAADRRKEAEDAYRTLQHERRKAATDDDNAHVVLATPETHPELWRWQDGYNKYFPQWHSMKYYKATRTEN